MTYITRLYLSALRWVVIASMIGMLGLIFSNVVLRYAFSSGIFLAEGVSGLLHVWMTFVGALLVLYDKGHIGVEILFRRLPAMLQSVAFAVTHLIMLYVTWLFLTGSWQQMIINLNVISPATKLPMAMLYAAGVFFSAFSAVFLASQLIALLRGKLSPSDLIIAHGEDEEEAERLIAEGAIK
ncbi:TRAP transporter small permease [Brucellaceae bacterium D45D]